MFIHELPNANLKQDPLIRIFHSQGFNAYSPGPSTTAFSIFPNPEKHFWFEIHSGVANPNVPKAVLVNWNSRKLQLSEIEAGTGIDTLDKRVEAWIAGFGMAALGKGDLKTTFAAIEAVAGSEFKNNVALQYHLEQVVSALLGLPKER